MSVLDLIISAIVLFGLWRGYVRGAVKTVLSLVSWVVALIVASQMAKGFAPLFVGFTSNETLQLAMAFLAIVLVVLVGLGLICFIIVKALKAVKLTLLDKVAGAGVGIGLGFVKVLFVLSLVSPILVKTDTYHNSPLAQALLPYAPLAKELVSNAFGKAWDEMNKPN